MPYILKKSNGRTLTTVADGSIDTTTPLTFVGKNYAGYGQIIDQNLVYLLENFANASQPAKAVVGQLWFDSASKNLRVYDGTKFKSLAQFNSTGSAPTDNVKGDLWFNESEQKLYLYNGSRFVFIGPQDSQLAGVQITSTTVLDNNNNQRYVMKFTITDPNTNEQTIAGVISKDSFTPNPIDDLIAEGFNVVKAGITLPGSNAVNGNTESSQFYFWGTTPSALGFYNQTSQTYHTADEYLLATEYYSNLNNGFSINNDAGLVVGYAGVLQISAISSGPYDSEGVISAINGYKISLNAVNTLTSVLTNMVTFDQNNVVPNTTWGINLGTTSSYFSNAYINTATVKDLYSANFVGTLTGKLIGNVQGNVTGNITGNSFGSHTGGVVTTIITANGGSAQLDGNWSLTSGSTLKATYADLAERYHADAVYDFGTVLVVGGENEVTVSTNRADISIAGVVSNNPAYMMNSEAGSNETHPYIALKGRVPCRVTGIIYKGNLLVSSSMAGHAELYQEGDNPQAVIGVALENFSGHSGIVEIKV
jgi:hypothetical protein